MLRNYLNTDNIWESCIYDILHPKHDKLEKDLLESALLSLNKHLRADYVYVERFSPNSKAMDIVCACNRSDILPPSFFNKTDSQRDEVLREHIITIKENMRAAYPDNPLLSKLKIEAYSRIVLLDSTGMPIGVLTALFCDKIKDVIKTEGLMFIISHTLSRNLECAGEQKLQERKSAELLLYKEELERTNKQLDKTKKQLEAAHIKAAEGQQLKASFLANLSHEIRTPMNAIMGFTELLKSNGLAEEERKEYIDIVLQNGSQLLHVMDNIMEISKLQTEQGFEKKERVMVNDIITDLYHNYTRKLQKVKKPIKLILLMGNQNGKDVLLANKNALHKILDHLINNAVKFSKKGCVFIGYTVENHTFEFFVKDSGIGIPAGEEKSIFDMFRQLNVGMSREFEGNGVGLSIAKKYVESMGGQIWTEPAQKTGALIKFTIPAG
ncbi:Signal transduction histidine kinase [Saccharicrinis carchari]|uniref:histidine kinase n=2 Tax=Saccharicrinis carchari TaxID=1168039 RepID=A0A521DCK1_SACCC|nr:Signal transduction histidine kinase [Saccharicrinis carchari]